MGENIYFWRCEILTMISYVVFRRIRLQVGIDPCRFCGIDEEFHIVRLTKKLNSNIIPCSCKYHYKGMTYRMAVNSTAHSVLYLRRDNLIQSYNLKFTIWPNIMLTRRIPGQPLHWQVVDSFITSEEEV